MLPNKTQLFRQNQCRLLHWLIQNNCRILRLGIYQQAINQIHYRFQQGCDKDRFYRHITPENMLQYHDIWQN